MPPLVAPRGGLAHTLSRLRSYLLLDPLIFLYTAVMGAGSLTVSLFDREGRIQHGFARVWSRMILATVRSPVDVVGREHLITPAVIAANHLSAMDVPVLYAYLPFPFRIVAKKELFRYPFVGWHLHRSGQIPIDSSSPRATIKTLGGVAVDDLNQGLSVVIFPEGGRSPSGQVQPFMNGAFYVAVKAQAPIVPVAIVGTFEMLPINTFHIMPRRLKLVAGPPIPTTGLGLRDMDALAERVRSAIEGMYYAHGEVPPPRPVSTG